MLTDPFEEQNKLLDDREETMDKLLIRVTAARGEVFLKEIQVYG